MTFRQHLKGRVVVEKKIHDCPPSLCEWRLLPQACCLPGQLLPQARAAEAPKAV